MRRVVVVACLVAVTLGGCATHPAQFVPAGVDREGLAAAIRQRGEDTAAEGGPPEYPPPPAQSVLDRAPEVVILTGAYAVLGTLYVAGFILYALAKRAGS